jgi:hypothetical protein
MLRSGGKYRIEMVPVGVVTCHVAAIFTDPVPHLWYAILVGALIGGIRTMGSNLIENNPRKMIMPLA